MNRQVAFAYAGMSVAMAIAALAVVGSALGFTESKPESAPAEEYAATDTQQDNAFADYQQQQLAYIESQAQAALGDIEAQRAAAQQQAAAEITAQRAAAQEAAARDVAAQRTAAQKALAREIAAQKAAAEEALAAEIRAQQEAAQDALAAATSSPGSAGSSGSPNSQLLAWESSWVPASSCCLEKRRRERDTSSGCRFWALQPSAHRIVVGNTLPRDCR